MGPGPAAAEHSSLPPSVGGKRPAHLPDGDVFPIPPFSRAARCAGGSGLFLSAPPFLAGRLFCVCPPGAGCFFAPAHSARPEGGALGAGLGISCLQAAHTRPPGGVPPRSERMVSFAPRRRADFPQRLGKAQPPRQKWGVQCSCGIPAAPPGGYRRRVGVGRRSIDRGRQKRYNRKRRGRRAMMLKSPDKTSFSFSCII